MKRDVNTDSQIARGLRTGDCQTWLMLYDTYADKLWQNVARLMPRDQATVADIVQETFLTAARSARTYDPHRGSPWIWLWTIAKRQVALHYRKMKSEDMLQQALAWWVTLDGQKQHMVRCLQTPPQ